MIIAYPGNIGSFSEQAALEAYPDYKQQSYPLFPDTLKAVLNGNADVAIIPIENIIGGGVEATHQLLHKYHNKLHIVGEHFSKIEHCLFGTEEASLETIETLYSHPQALAQCLYKIHNLKLKTIPTENTVFGAEKIRKEENPTLATICSKKAGEKYGLKLLLKENIANVDENYTRFVLLASKPYPFKEKEEKLITSMIFTVKNIPAALFKALGGFATNGVNMTKLVSAPTGNQFTPSEFYTDVEGNIKDPALTRALDELKFFSEDVKMLGCYPAHPYRFKEDKKTLK